MDNPEYEKLLLEIADNVERLVSVPENRRRFEQQTCNSGKRLATYVEAKEWADKKHAEQERIALTKRKLSDQISYLKSKGWVEADLSPLNMGVYSQSHLKPPSEEMPPDPLLGFIPTSNGEPPPLKIDEALANYYFLLATIHDKVREEYIPINNDIWPERLAKSVWAIMENLYVDKQFIIKTALDHVIADLAEEEPTETDLEQGKIGFLQELTPEEPSE